MAQVRRHAWWVVPALAVPAIVVAVVGWAWLVMLYLIANSFGTWLRVDGPGFAPRSRGSWRSWATIAQLPVGVLGVLGIKSSDSPSSCPTASLAWTT